MNTVRLALAGALAALFTVVSAGTAQAYPDPSITLSVDSTTVVGGNPVSFTADAGGTNCIEWTVTYLGQTRTGSGSSFSGTFDTPAVTTSQTDQITAKCTSATGSASTGVSITLIPKSSGGNGTDTGTSTSGSSSGSASSSGGLLPNTGGASFWILLAGGALVVVGGGAVIVNRRRA